MKFQDLKKSLSNIKPVYLVRGSDAYLRQKTVEMIVNTAVQNKQLNVSNFNDENTDMSAIISSLKSIPMLDKYRVVVLQDIAVKKVEDIKPIIDYASHPVDTSILLIVDGQNFSVYKKLESVAEIVDCSPMDEMMLAKIVATQLKKYNCIINSDALVKLVGYCNADYTRINNEVIKLGNMLEGGVVTSQIIDEYVHREVEYDVFELGKAVSVKNGAKAIDIINNLLERKESPQVLLMLVLSNFRRMFYAITSRESNIDIANKLGVKEYSIKVAREVGSAFSPAQLKRILDLGADLDYKIKSGQIADKTALLYFVSNIVNL